MIMSDKKFLIITGLLNQLFLLTDFAIQYLLLLECILKVFSKNITSNNFSPVHSYFIHLAPS